MTEIILSDGLPAEIRTLGIFELDPLSPKPMGRYAYRMEFVSGEVEYVEFPIERYKEPPQKPDIPEEEIEPKSAAWWKLLTWQRYQAALLHEQRRLEQTAVYMDDVLDYIINNCATPDIVARLITDEDWDKFIWVAIVPQLTKEMLAKTMRTSYKASYDDMEIFEALDQTSGGLGVYDGIRLWESELMVAWGMREDEYATVPIDERARKVVALNLNKWLAYLDADRSRKQAELERLQRQVEGAKK